jgi:hypothetical protein
LFEPMARKNTRFGEQPIWGVIRRRHWNLRLIAYETGVAYSHLINAANGITPPSPQLRQKLRVSWPADREALQSRRSSGHVQRGQGAWRQDQPQVRETRGMKRHVRDALREAGAEAGRKARADAGLPQHVEDPEAIQRMAELFIKVCDRRDAA